MTLPVFGLLFLSFHLYTITPEQSLHSPSIPWCGGAKAYNPFSPTQNIVNIKLALKKKRETGNSFRWGGAHTRGVAMERAGSWGVLFVKIKSIASQATFHGTDSSDI
jgi:hypothetical protein